MNIIAKRYLKKNHPIKWRLYLIQNYFKQKIRIWLGINRLSTEIHEIRGVVLDNYPTNYKNKCYEQLKNRKDMNRE